MHGFYRPNLYYQVENCPDENFKMACVRKALEQTPAGRVIIYCGTRRYTEVVADELSLRGPGVGCYHAGMSASDRNRIQSAFEHGEIRILVATNAFGMGIDRPDVRLVVHFNLPANIDSLYQEMGRAGRDGSPSTCLLLYSSKDKGLQSFFIQSSQAPRHIKSSRWNTLNALVDYAEGGECRHSEILTYYQDSYRITECGHCDVCAPESDRRITRPVLEIEDPRPTRAQKKAAAAKSRPPEELDNAGQLRFELLRDWRRNKAKELDVAAFMIFSDRTLRHLAQENPDSISTLADIYGFGAVKLERFGQEVLQVLSMTT